MIPSHITWRGELRSCNYTCAYCPFATHTPAPQEIARDTIALDRFLGWLPQSGFAGSILLAPHGEALIHRQYQSRFAQLSLLPGVAMASCQTNLSWDARAFLQLLDAQGADCSRLALWATYHPAMADLDAFAAKCALLARRLRLSVGMVGDPRQIDRMRALKKALPHGVSFWVNAMDGLGRRYTPAEEAAFSRLDPLFPLERRHFPCDRRCTGLFVDARACVAPCNRVPKDRSHGCLYDNAPLPEIPRQRGRCDCFLAYSNRRDLPELVRLGPWPQLRLAWRPQALFFDLDGTLAHNGHISRENMQLLIKLSRRWPVYLMTARPRENAVRPLRDNDVLAGGIFCCGAEVVDSRSGRQLVIPLPVALKGARTTNLADGAAVGQRFSHPPDPLPPGLRRVYSGPFSVVAAQADKRRGVETICQWNGWDAADILVCGNGPEDAEALRAVPCSVAPPASHKAALAAARHHLDFSALAAVLLQMQRTTTEKAPTPPR